MQLTNAQNIQHKIVLLTSSQLKWDDSHLKRVKTQWKSDEIQSKCGDHFQFVVKMCILNYFSVKIVTFFGHELNLKVICDAFWWHIIEKII